MQTRISGIFGSYDLFAKAFPGTVFLLCFISLLPQGAFNYNLRQSGALFAALTLLIIVLGFVFGQAVHGMAVQVERGFYTVSKKYYSLVVVMKKVGAAIFEWILRKISREGYSNDQGKGDTESQEKEDDEQQTLKWYDWIFLIGIITPIFISVLILVRTGDWVTALLYLILYLIPTYTLIEYARKWVRQVLSPHRKLFEEDMNSNNGLNNEMQAIFLHRMAQIYQIDGSVSDANLHTLYTLTMSHLEYVGSGRARQFQAIFSFCRSMWVTMFIFSLLFIILSFSEVISKTFNGSGAITLLANYSPLISDQLGGNKGLIIVGVSMFVMVFLFMEGERQYKSLFVDYVIADFITSTNDGASSKNVDRIPRVRRS